MLRNMHQDRQREREQETSNMKNFVLLFPIIHLKILTLISRSCNLGMTSIDTNKFYIHDTKMNEHHYRGGECNEGGREKWNYTYMTHWPRLCTLQHHPFIKYMVLLQKLCRLHFRVLKTLAWKAQPPSLSSAACLPDQSHGTLRSMTIHDELADPFLQCFN